MRKLQALVAHLVDATHVPRENFHAFADQGSLLPTGKHLGVILPEAGEDTPPREQLEVGIWQYEGVIQVERYAGDAQSLMAIILGWLASHDTERCLQNKKDPELTIELNDMLTADVDISIEFEEAVTVMEEATGSITFAGKRWSISPVEIVAATRLHSVKAVKNG